MRSYLHEGCHECVLPIKLGRRTAYMRVWIEMEEIVGLLKKLDELFGEAGKPYCVRLEEVPLAQEKLVDLIVDRLLEKPDLLRLACVERRVADGLRARYAVREAAFSPRFPPSIDQVMLERSDLTPLLTTLLARRSRKRGAARGP